MRVVYLAPQLMIAGGIRVIVEHVNRLGARGHDCHIVVRSGKPELSWLETTAEIHPYGEITRLARDADAVVATAWFTAYDVQNLPTGPKKCYLVQGRETVFFPDDEVRQAQVEATFRKPFEYMTVSSYLVDYLKEQGVRATLVKNGVDFDLFYPDPDPFPRTGGRKRVLVEGDPIQPWKGVQKTIEALAPLGVEIFTFGPSAEVPAGSDRHFAAPDQDTIRRIYSSVDVVAKGSKLEGFGYGPAEAMACGSAVAITEFGGGRDICIDGKTALVAPPEDYAALAGAVRRLLEDDELRQRLAAAGHEHVKATLRWDDSIDLLEETLAKGIPRKRLRHKASADTVKPLPVHVAGVYDEAEGHPTLTSKEGFPAPVASIVIPVHNQADLTEMCLATIERCTTDVEHEIIVIDNASTDHTKEVLAKHPQVRVIRNSKNRGVGPAWNQGIRASKGTYVAVVNNDVVVSPGWLGRLIKGFDLDPKLGIVCPRFTHHDLPQDFDEQAAKVARQPAALSYEKQPDAFLLLVGFAFVLSREVIDAVGLFDEEFGLMLYEDRDYEDRVLAAGFRIASVSNVLIHHFQSRTVFTIQDWMKYEIRNRERYAKKAARRAGRGPPQGRAAPTA